MPAKTLGLTTMNPDTRRLLRVTLDEPVTTEEVVTDLMGKQVDARREFIMSRAATVDSIDV